MRFISDATYYHAKYANIRASLLLLAVASNVYRPESSFAFVRTRSPTYVLGVKHKVCGGSDAAGKDKLNSVMLMHVSTCINFIMCGMKVQCMVN